MIEAQLDDRVDTPPLSQHRGNQSRRRDDESQERRRAQVQQEVQSQVVDE